MSDVSSLIQRIKALRCPDHIKRDLMELVPILRLSDLIMLEQDVIHYERQYQAIEDGTAPLTPEQSARLHAAQKTAQKKVMAAAEVAVLKDEQRELRHIERQFAQAFTILPPQ